MTYTNASMKAAMRERLMRLSDVGPGLHPYALHEAAQAVKDDPVMYEGLVAEIGKHIGPKACVIAQEWAKRMGVDRAESVFDIPRGYGMTTGKKK